MKIWAVANQKGGVGKTTTTISLAGHMALAGKRTLLVDLDPQGSLTSYLGHDPDTMDDSVFTLFESGPTTTNVVSVLHSTLFENVSLLPASTVLATLERQFGAKDGMGLVVATALSRVKRHFDYVLIDCPPILGVLMVNAMVACDRLIIPVQTEYLALKGLERMLRTVQMIEHTKKSQLDWMIVPTMFDKRTKASLQSLQILLQTYGANVWDNYIPIDTQFRDASTVGKPLPLLNTRSRGSIAYGELFEAFGGEAMQPFELSEEALI